MDYPVWEPFIANGLIIAVVAILHVFVSHFAIGGGLYLVVAETIARKKNDAAHLAHVVRFSKFFVLLTLVWGAVTGVGIWVTIGLIHPVGTKWLINNFVWGWATEWVFFFVEITAALLYYYGWKRLTAKAHMAIGWIYFAAAWLSLVVINGILTFMLTPGQWLVTGNFWDGFLNPSYIPATVFRTFVALVLAGLYVIFALGREKNIELKTRLIRANGIIVIIALVLSFLSGLWYFKALPMAIQARFLPGTVPLLAFQVMIFGAIVLAVLTLIGAIFFPRNAGYISGAILLLVGLLTMGGFEWARESVRKPFIIEDFLYGNGRTVAQTGANAGQPIAVKFTTGDHGRDLFLSACRSCHTISNYHALDTRLAGMNEQHIANIIPRLQHFINKMPPFPGNADDAAALARYLKSKAQPDPLKSGPDLTEAQKEEIVFKRRCGGCHALYSPLAEMRPIGANFEGISSDEAKDNIGMLPELTDAMPPFTGDDEELRLLINYLTGGPKQ